MSIPDYQSLMLPVLGAAIRKSPKAKPVQPAWRMLKLKAAADYLGVSTGQPTSNNIFSICLTNTNL